MKKILLFLLILTATAFAVTTAPQPPQFELYINGLRAQNNDTISSTPSIEVHIIGTSSLDAGSIRFAYSKGLTTTEVTDFTKDIVSSTECEIYYKPTTALSDGIYVIWTYAKNISGEDALFESTGLRVLAASEISLQGNPLNYPNPFVPSNGTYISYYLTNDSNVNINIYDIAGNVIAKKACAIGGNGGSAGYNEVFWDGRTNGGDSVGNGMYVYLIIADGSMIGKGKMTALR